MPRQHQDQQHDPMAESSHFGLPLCLRFQLSLNEMQQLATAFIEMQQHLFSNHQNLTKARGPNPERLNIHWEDEVVSGSSPWWRVPILGALRVGRFIVGIDGGERRLEELVYDLMQISLERQSAAVHFFHHELVNHLCEECQMCLTVAKGMDPNGQVCFFLQDEDRFNSAATATI